MHYNKGNFIFKKYRYKYIIKLGTNTSIIINRYILFS